MYVDMQICTYVDMNMQLYYEYVCMLNECKINSLAVTNQVIFVKTTQVEYSEVSKQISAWIYVE